MVHLNSNPARRSAPGLIFACLNLAAVAAWGQAAPAPAPAAPSSHFGMLEEYCSECHNSTDWAGGVAFDTLSEADVPEDTKLWEGAVRKLRGHLMPPPGSKQPTQAQADSFVKWLQTSLDARTETPRAGHVTAQRLNRTEYANAVRSLLGVEIKVEDLLPPEIEADGFDNIAAALTVSPSFLDQYIGAARFIAGRAVGSANAKLGKTLYLPASGTTDDMPLGSRGGYSFKHFFPADGEYRLSILDDLTGGLYTNPALYQQTIVIFIDGSEVFRRNVGGKEDLGLADREAADGRAKVNSRFANIPVKVTSGSHVVTVTSVERARVLSDETIGGAGAGGFGAAGTGARLTAGVEVSGPFGPTTIGHSPSRDKIFVCHPASQAEERPCAEKIARHLATQAYRRPVTDADIAKLMAFYDSGRKDLGDFDGGVQEITMGVLSSPDFLYRIIQPRGDGKSLQPLTALELASRLSFFLWSDLPDDELLQVAISGKLTDPAVYDKQVDRMLADKRASALVTGFAMRWLNVDDLKAVDPDPTLFSKFSEGLRQDFSTEIRLFLGDVLMENRNVLELLSANYTFLNQRLAEHYGVSGVLGSQFRRVTVSDPNRRGLLGKSAVLLRTSYGDRTSPVLRGAWVLEKLMGTPPTPPPPGVETNLNAKEGSQPTTLRARLELHRQSKTCSQCHGVIDPIGLALENFDVTGAWRTRDTGLPVNSATVLPSGVAITGAAQLNDQLLGRPDEFVQTMTEKLLMYATGREVEPSDMPQVRQIVRDAGKDDYRFFDLVKGIVRSDAFRMQAPPHEGAHGEQPKPTLASAR
jgi:mono/diheme cytochrome c family protein